MEITKFDIMFTTSMALAVVLMGIIFPYVGLVQDDQTTVEDIPKPDPDSWTFEGGEFEQPDKPLSSTEDRIEYYQGDDSVNIDIWENRSQYPKEVVMVEAFATNDNITTVNLFREVRQYDGLQGEDYISELNQSSTTFNGSDVGNETRLSVVNGSFVVDARLEEYEDDAQDGNDRWQIVVDAVEISDQSGQGFYSWYIDKGFDVGKTVIWVGQVLMFGVLSIIEIALSIGSVGFGSAVWLIDIGTWLSTGYYSIIVTSNSSWVVALLYIPILGLIAELVKFGIIIIKVLPLT